MPASGYVLSEEAAHRIVLTAAAERRLARRPFLRDHLVEVLSSPDAVRVIQAGLYLLEKRLGRRVVTVKVRRERRSRSLPVAAERRRGADRRRDPSAPLVISVEQSLA